jgi:hypothetical protein
MTFNPTPELSPDVSRLRIVDPYDRFWQNRAATIADLFARDSMSIDGIALAVVALSSLAEFRYADLPRTRDKDQQRFRRLLTEHCPSFENRISIPELLRNARHDPQFAGYMAPILSSFPIAGALAVRRTSEDPFVDIFNTWADAQTPSIPDELKNYDYAGCIFKHYRNSVLHESRVGKGREARGYGIDEHDAAIFYDNSSGGAVDPIEYIRFGIYPPYLLRILREVIISLRSWAITNNCDLFS